MSEHHHHDNPHVQHHFVDMDQQMEAGKLGMWLFLATEVLLFGGLFAAYAIGRALHPEAFEYGASKLDRVMGGINTLVLIFSSFTMAWAVRAAQKTQNQLCAILLAITFVCGCGFMGIKYFEYSAKFEHGYLWAAGTGKTASVFEPKTPYSSQTLMARQAARDANGVTSDHHGPSDDHGSEEGASHDESTDEHATDDSSHATTEDHGAEEASHDELPEEEVVQTAAGHSAVSDIPEDERSTLAPAAQGPTGAVAELTVPGTVDTSKYKLYVRDEKVDSGDHGHDAPPFAHLFFGIYFVMTGLHGIHVFLGMGVIGWLFFRALRNEFSSKYYAPVDIGGLYWHLVDLIWIFLFPLLYLI